MSPSASTSEETCHASCVVLDEDGVLIRGAPGTGKSSLCLSLLDRAAASGRHARLVADDRVRLSARNGRLVARPHPALAGLIEVRGVGPVRLGRHADAAVVRLVIDLVPELSRLPEDDSGRTVVLGLDLPALRLEPRQPREYLIGRALLAVRQERAASASVSWQTHPTGLVSIGP